MHHDVALAVGSSATVPTTVNLSELERRRTPRRLIEWRLDVIVGVEQDRGCGAVGA
jgi:hypothetical protein